MSIADVKSQLDSLLTEGVLTQKAYDYMTKKNFRLDFRTWSFYYNAIEQLKENITKEINNQSNLTDRTKESLCKIIDDAWPDIGQSREFGDTNEETKYAQVVVLRFDNSDLYRASMFDALNIYGGLYRDHTGEGVYNILALFNNGAVHGGMGAYHLKTTIGSEEGDDTLSYNHTYYPPLHFLQRAVDRFNHDYVNKYQCIAELGDAYLA